MITCINVTDKKQEQHPQRAEPDGPKARVLWLCRWLPVVVVLLLPQMTVMIMMETHCKMPQVNIRLRFLLKVQNGYVWCHGGKQLLILC